MANYVELSGLNTWYDEHGAGEPVVLLHPGGADARAFGPNLDELAARFHVYTPDRRGHGHTPDAEGPISYELMAHDTIRFIETVVRQPAHLVGMSDGAIVALLVCLRRPDLATRLVFVAGVFHRDGWGSGVLDADDDPPEFFVNSYSEVSPDGRAHHPIVAAKLARMHAEEPSLTLEELHRVATRTLVMVGDDDEVRLEHAIELYRAVPDCELAILPGTSHGLLVEKPGLSNTIIIDFLTTEPIPTLAPIRRKRPPSSA
jgi:pimeloyl-ACP methyl ester carboxylesterase